MNLLSQLKENFKDLLFISLDEALRIYLIYQVVHYQKDGDFKEYT